MPTPPRRRVVALALVTLTALASTATLPAQASPTPRPVAYVPRIALPVGFQPEGIAIGREPVVYSGSRITGDIYAADLRTGKGRVVVKGPGTASLGLKVDGRRLFVAGGGAGDGRVVDVSRGTTVRSFSFTTNPSFVNDVVLTEKYAWFTDSRQSQLYRVDRHGRSEIAVTLPLRGDWVQDTTPGTNNANGIARTPDGKALLVVQSNTGFLFRVDPRTGVARRVDLGGTLLTAGDGLLLQGRTLYAVQNRLNQVAVLHLNRAGTRGTLTRTLTSPEFSVPSTVAAYRGSLYLPNARFGVVPDPATADYQITRVTP